MNKFLSRKTRAVALKASSVVTGMTTVLSLSGLMYFAPVASAAIPSDYGLKEGDTISAAGSDDPDIYIVNEHGFKRLFLNPVIFNFYGHLGGFANVKNVSSTTRDAFGTSGLFRNCETGDQKVYGVESTGEDTAMLHWVNTSGSQAVADDANFFKKVFCINNNEFSWYSKGSDYTSVSQVPNYSRTPGATPTPVVGAISVSLASGNPAAQTITKNAAGAEVLRVRLSGSGTVNTVTLKRLGPGAVADFTNVYVYDGAERLVSGKTFSTSSGEATFLLNLAVSGTKDLSFVADMAGSAATAGNVNYVQVTGVTAAGGASVSGLPVTGNNITISGASSGGVTLTTSGSMSNPTVGQKGVQIGEFKVTANTEAASMRRFSLLNGGNVRSTDLTNVKLTTGSSTWTGTSTADGYLVFDLGSGHTIAKGGNAIFKVYADVGGKKDETIKLYFETDADTLAIGDQYGYGMAVTDTDVDASGNVSDLTLQGGVLTLAFNGPPAQTVGTTVTDITLLKYSMTAAANIEVKKTEFTLCKDDTGDGTYDAAADATNGWADLTDFKIWDEGTGAVIMGPHDGSAFTGSDAGSCPDSVTGAQKEFTDAFDLLAGQTYNFKVTADVTADDTGSGIKLASTDIFRAVLDDYSDDAAVTVMKYSGTTTAVAAADMVPRADLAGNNITLSSSSLTLSLAGNPASQTKIRGSADVDAVGITFAAGQASELKVTTIKITGYAADTAGDTYDEGTPDADNDNGVSVANMAGSVELYDSTGTLVGGSSNVTNNALGTGGTGTMTFSNLNWVLPAGTSKTLLVRADLSNNTASGTAGDLYAFDIAATTDITALDKDSNTVNAGNAGVNGTTSPTKVLTVKNSGSMTLATSADTPSKGAVYWGQANAPISKFRLTSTDEGQYLEKLTIAASVGAEATAAAANVKEVLLTYKNKAGSTLTTTQSFGNAASVNFAWAAGDANRPYVPKDSSLDIAVNANMKTKAEGATQMGANTTRHFSLDLVDKFNGSHTNGFRAVGEGSGTVLDGTATGINDVVGANNQYIYRVFPKFDVVTLSAPYDLVGNPTVFKFSITAMGLTDSTLRFDNEDDASGSIKFEIISSGAVDGDTTVSTYNDSTSEVVDTVALTNDGNASPNASYTLNFTSKDIEITGGSTKTFRIQLDSTSVYDDVAGTGVGADYFQVVLRDEGDTDTNIVRWVGNYDNTTGSEDTTSTAGVLRNLPLFGPNFTR
ncbi:MAG: hypothetical protein Q7S32_04600 [bacterium]|nr:hypothetical protein [bacterium]